MLGGCVTNEKRGIALMDMTDVRLEAPADSAAELTSFYLDRLSLERAGSSSALLDARIGGTRLRFLAAPPDSAPFYHFALLVPGNRLAAAHRWLGARTRLLPDPDTGSTVFDFSNWDAGACYCLDPVGNIVELIGHRGLAELPYPKSDFGADESLDSLNSEWLCKTR